MAREVDRDDLAFKLCSFAVQSMLYEAACFPSPGLVSPVSSGAHKDMDFFSFLDSSASLIKTLTLCSKAGYCDDSPLNIFNSIRDIGKAGEAEMFERTAGINTHKGMLFLMGTCCAAVSKIIYEKQEFIMLQDMIKLMTAGLVGRELTQLDNNKALSHGERLYLKYGTKGIRGEVEKGLPIIFDFALDFYNENKDLNKNNRLVHTLIGIMQYCEDSTVLHRHSMDTLRQLQSRAKETMEIGGMRTSEGREAIKSLDKELIRLNISPGGCADLLGTTVFLDLVRVNLFNL